MTWLRDILDICNNFKQSSHFKGKSGKIEHCLHILALIRGLSLSLISFRVATEGGWAKKCEVQQTPDSAGVLRPWGSTPHISMSHPPSGLPRRHTP